MFDTQDIPRCSRSITLGDGITVEFNEESMLNFYDSDSDEPMMKLDPADLSVLYAAYRAVVREELEESAWGGCE